MLISIFSIFIVFFIYLYLVIKSFKGNQIINFTIFSFFRFSINLFKTILYIPFIEIFFTVIVCDRAYFNDDIKCWKFEHIIYFVLCIISFLLLIFLCYIFTSVSFDKNEKFSSSVSKYLIINSNIILLLCRALNVILLELCIVSDLINITIIILFLSSSLSAYCIFIERKFQNIKRNITINIQYIFNLFFFANCLMLLICNLIKSKKFKGMFQIFIVISFIVLLYIFSTSIIQVNILKRPLKKEREIYNNIRIIIQFIENKEKNRNYLLKLLSYSINLTHGDHLSKIKNISILKKIIELYNKEINEEAINKLDYYFYLYIDGLYNEGLKHFRDSPLLLVNYSIFQLEKMHRYHKAYSILLKCLYLPNLSFSEEFFIYRIKRNLEEKGNKLGREHSYISYTYQVNSMLSLISEVSYSYTQLYGILLNDSKINEINNLKEVAIKIYNTNKKIQERYDFIESSGFNNKKLSIFYHNFLKDILYETSNDTKILNEEQLEDEIKIDSLYFDINSINTKSNFQFLIASGENKNFGTIMKISLELCEILGYSDKDVIGQNINIFIPNILRIPHENFLRKKINEQTENQMNKKLKSISVCLRSSSRFLIPLNLEVGIFYNENNQALLFAQLINSNSDYYKKCVVIVNTNLIIQIFSANAIYLLGLNNSIINDNVEITTFFLEFYNECLNYLSSNSIKKNKDILCIKIKLIKETFLNDSEIKIITWKNHKKFKVEWKELKFGEKNYGYSIFFEQKELNEDDKMNIDELLSTRRVKKRASNVSVKLNSSLNEIAQVIHKDYIPQIEGKVNFNITEKNYLMNNNSLDNGESIQNYFEKKYKEIKEESEQNHHNINKNERKNSSSIFQSESSGYDENEYDDSFSNNEEEEEETIKNNEIIPKEIIIENNKDDTYYEVNLKKVFLQIYDFKNNIIKDCKDYIVQSKINKIFKEEKDITKNKLDRKYSEKVENIKSNKNTNLFNNKKIDIQGNYNNDFQNNMGEKIINKIKTPKLINQNALIYFIFYIFQFLSLIITAIILFNTINNHKEEIYSIFITIYNQCNIISHIGLIQFYIFEYILLKNPKYYNFYQNRTRFRESIIPILNDLYLTSMEEVKSFDYIEENYDKSNIEKLKNLKGDFLVYYEDELYIPESKIITYSPDHAIKEFLFSLFKLLISKENEINFLNINLYFIQMNSGTLSDILSIKIEIYINCIKSLINHTKELSWIFLAIHIVVCIISVILCSWSINKIIKEKEKYLGMFYKIDSEIVKMLLLKCEPYTKIQVNKDSNINPNNILEVGEDDNEINSLLDNMDNENNNKNNFIKDKFHNGENMKNLKKMSAFLKNMEFKKSFFLKISFLIILTLMILLLILLFNNSYKKYELSSNVIYNIEVELKYISSAINSMRLAIVYSALFYKEPFLLTQLIDFTIPTLTLNYSKVKEIEILLHSISIANNLPGNSSKILNTYLTDNYCKLFTNFSLENNISCERFSYNISNFGLPTIQVYFFSSLILAGYSLTNLTEESIINENYYYEPFYSTPIYIDDNDNDNDNENYIKGNPFLVINEEGMRNSNIIFTELIYPKFQYLIYMIYSNLTDYNKSLNNLVLIFGIVYFGYIMFIYSFYIFPFIFKENDDLNKTKMILGVIPKMILYDIIKSEYLNEAEIIK